MEQFAKEVTLLDLPSPLWAIHIHPEYEYISILHINVTSEKIVVDKGITLVEENDNLSLKIFLNGFISNIPDITINVTVSDLSALLSVLHDKNVCANSTDVLQHPHCLKLVENNLNDSERDVQYCEVCRSKDVPEAYSRLRPSFKELSGNDLIKSEDCEIICSQILGFNLSEPEQCTESTKDVEECTINKSKSDENIKKDQCTDNKGLCNICGKILASRHRTNEHLLTHSSEKRYHCPICKKGFAKSFNLKMHEHIHSGERPYICDACGKSYKTGSNLKTHMLSCHGEGKRFSCDICQKSFVYPRYLKLHMRKHTGERPYQCAICEKKFAKNIHLTVHLRTHTGEKPYGCMICGKSFSTTGGLGSHQKTRHKVG